MTTGWLPLTVYALTAAAVVAAVGRRSRRWLSHWVPAALMMGFAYAAAMRLFVKHQGWSEEAASWQTVSWNVVGGFALGMAMFDWTDSRMRHRVVSVLAVLLCVLSGALALNAATGYFPTVVA